ncbi:2576_t:CDS:2 [Paraglomus occultum]|uniref:2576_t:CDS:1 n=1 Tax=Paraglomus occultum TaxID=144539 RepID=A0A9N9GRA5_9GLOM|nr:2576_t:CDS:2 [Paraglomus occultum]
MPGGYQMIAMEYIEVFADLRPPNILVVTRDGKHRAMLIDFDWCGKDGIDTYPSSMNMDQITWPERVIPGTVLKKEDDKFMLDKLKYSLNL